MANILVVDDDPHIRLALGEILKAWGHVPSLAESYAQSLTMLENPSVELALADVNLPDGSGIDLVKFAKEKGLGIPIIILTGHGTIEAAVEAIQLGAENYLTKPVEPNRLRLLIEQALEKAEMREEVATLRKELRKAGKVGDLIGKAARMQELYLHIERVAITDAAVLITGESGTGKTLIAKTVHDHSKRRKKPFVAVNCAAISPTLIESELFGHEKGSFTGANAQRRGYFEEAFGGTVFLDEITELPIDLQGKLLRVLEEKRIRRIGSTQEIETNVRLITATNRDPKVAIEDGKLREDLYYRINIFDIHAPSLRERAEDVPMLAQSFLEKLAEEEERPGVAFEPVVLDVLKAYDWPGNVRELRNVVNRALIIAVGDRIGVQALPEKVRQSIDLEAILEAHRNAAVAPSDDDPEDTQGTGGRVLQDDDDEDEDAEPSSKSPARGASAGRATATARKPQGKGASEAAAAQPGDPAAILAGESSLEAMEKIMIRRCLAETGGNKPQVAEKLGISLKTLYNKIKKYEL